MSGPGAGASIALADGLTGAASAAATASLPVRFACVGSRTTRERKARGKGIEVYRIGTAEHEWEPLQTVELVNPSFLIRDDTGKFVFTVHGDQRDVSAFRIGDDGRLALVNTVTTRGANPVHLHYDAASRGLVVANYATGSLVRLPVSPDGTLGEASEPMALPGDPGVHKTEQTSSHPHQVKPSPDRRFLFVPDKGLDRIFTVRLGPGGDPEEVTHVDVRQGAGPRHIDFTNGGRVAHVVNELDSTVTTFDVDRERGKLTPRRSLPSVPPDFVGDNRAAAMVASRDGRFVYASNRGHDTVVRFAVAGNGSLGDPRWFDTQGRGPRFVALSPGGRTLFAANELTDTIVPFAVDPGDGTLGPVGTPIRTGSPVSILFL